MSNFAQLEINERNRWVYFNKYRWVAHAAYWIWVLIVSTIMRAKGPITPSLVFNHFFLSNVMIATFFYLYCLYFIPYFFKRNKNLQFWLLMLVSLLGISAIDVFFGKTFVHLTDPVSVTSDLSFSKIYAGKLASYLLNFLFFSMMLFFMEKNEEGNTLLELEKEKKEIEQVKLDLLKSNINPDFLMRSLHQLKESAKIHEETTPEAILTFSDLLRYRLYRGRQLYSPLKEELAAFRSFLHFIGLDHLHHQLHIKLDVQGEDADQYIAPLSIVNLLEPFCKIIHDQAVRLDIVILIESDELHLEMQYGSHSTSQLLADLEAYRDNYSQLYGDLIKLYYECEETEPSFFVRLSLPIVGQQVTSEA
ncbi:histidine kinase [Pedobacter sp. N36a]|uniref:histidine kinase n=1 Tax=Pedobacter sp. N36a TaxID=2767996 RepID=UPI001657273F|nr:histidine kinase [Pedobacter sp. N36a]MBC8985276.1 histidine kinase [Pedobacter sp. N36a]